MCVPCDKALLSIPGTKKFYLVTLTLTFDLLLKSFNLRHNFIYKRDKAFILYMCIPCGKTFLLIPNILTL